MSNDVPQGQFGIELGHLITNLSSFREHIGYDSDLLPAIMLGNMPYPPTDIDDAFAGYMKSNSPERVAAFIHENAAQRHQRRLPSDRRGGRPGADPRGG